jgi:hypothetical protein
MEFASDAKIRQVRDLVDELFQHVLHDESNLFVSDEATIWDVSSAPVEEVLRRCADYYRVPVSREDLTLPLWELLPLLHDRRQTHRQGG